MIEDYCKFFQAIERNPEASISGLTVRDMLYLRQHLQMCYDCYMISERVNERYENKETTIEEFFNEN